MKTIHRYISTSFLATFVLANLVLGFVLSIVLLFKATSLIAAGASALLVGRYLWSGLPGTLSLSIPISALVSALLMFERLSSDNEISAMRACGIRLLDIMRMPVLLSILMTLICLHLNGSVYPDSTYARRDVRRMVSVKDVLATTRPGTFIDDFPGITFFVGSRDGTKLQAVRILEKMRSGQLREIKAQRATVSEIDGRIRLDLFNVFIDPVLENRPGSGYAEHAVRFIGAIGGKPEPDRKPVRRIKDRHSEDLLADILVSQRVPLPPPDTLAAMELSKKKTEISKRTVMALACLCFVLVGVPLGIKAHRRESGKGVVLGLTVAASFYLFLIAAESLATHVRFHPYWIAWVPVALCFILAGWLIARNP